MNPRYVVMLPTLLVLAISTALSVVVPGAGPAAGQGVPPQICVLEMPDAVILTPDGSIPFEVTIGIGADCEPYADASVVVEFSPQAEALLAWPVGGGPPIPGQFTDALGQATFPIVGAGCVDLNRFMAGTYVARIIVSGIVVAEIPVVTSPDVVNNDGLLPTELGTSICQNGVSAVGVSDAVFHTRAIKGGLIEPCSKLTGDPSDPVNLDDAVVLTPFVKTGAYLNCGMPANPEIKR